MNNKFKTYFMVGGFIVAIVIGFFITPLPEKNSSGNLQILEEDQESIDELQEEYIYVYLLGAVKEPGVIEAKKNARLYEIIELAGGVTDDADVQKINLASVVKDEDKIIVPFLISR